jgi:hypothetical protein
MIKIIFLNYFEYENNNIPGGKKVRSFLADTLPKSCSAFLNNFISLVSLLNRIAFPFAYFSTTCRSPEIVFVYLSIKLT